MKKEWKIEKGITLIALVITIIVLIILAGISIRLILGENGIISKSKKAEVYYEEAVAKEKLEIALLNLQEDKATMEEYNENAYNTYIDNYLSKEEMTVVGDIVIVDGWKFTIDKSVPKIGESLGKGEESKTITIVAEVEDAKDYTKSTINVEITYEGNITEIKIGNEEQTVPEKVDGKYTLSKEVLKNGKYIIYAKDEKDEYKIVKVEVAEISEDMDIKTPEDLVLFRDRVNKGATYVGKTVRMLNNIDLSSVCGQNVNGEEKSWIPISVFAGTFDGQGNMIENIYINVNGGKNALFVTNRGTIRNLIITGKMTTTSQYGNTTAGITTSNSGTIRRCINRVRITSSGQTGGIATVNSGNIEQCANLVPVFAEDGNIGGIVGVNTKGIIKECYNAGNVTGNNACEGGIVGTNANLIYNCYNKAKVSGTSAVGGITGVANGAYNKVGIKYTYNSYNIGNISGNSKIGQITGSENYECTSQSINCYENNITVTASKLNAGAYSDNVWLDDGKKIDENGNIVDNLDKDGNIQYINNGYPILKWQWEM